MKRKIVKHGSSTLTVSLPNKWAKKYGIKAGDELNVDEKGKELIVNAQEKQSLGSTTVHIPDKNNYIRRIFISPYIVGYDTIKVTFDSKEVSELLQQDASLLLGFEVVETGTNYCIFKNIAKGIEEELDPMFNRMVFFVISFGNDVCEALARNDYERLKTYPDYEVTVDKLNIFIRRMVNLGCCKNEMQSRILYRITSLIEAVSDELKYICTYAASEKIKVSKQVLTLFEEVNKLNKSACEYIKTANSSLLLKTKPIEKRLKSECLKLITTGDKKEAPIVHNLWSILNMLTHETQEVVKVID